MPELDVSDVSVAIAVVGFHIVILGLASYTLKERLYISDALIALVVGIIVGPIALNWVSQYKWTDDAEIREEITYQTMRLVLGVQVLFCGIALPKAYLWKEKLSLFILLIPVMTAAWFSSALLIWGLIPKTTFLSALLISGCITPTDPVLSNSIVKGRFAEKHVAPHVRNIIVAEAGANDGLGFPFVFMAYYLFRRHHISPAAIGEGGTESIGHAVGLWALDIIIYQIAISCVLGAIFGFIARKTLRAAEAKKMIDKDSFLAYGFGLALFVLGVVGILGSDDILCCFVVGNSFTWNDWYRVETEDEGFQDVLDTLINATAFIYIGTLIPWHEFGSEELGLSPWRLVVLGILVMLVRRLPWVMLLSHFIPALKTAREAAFSGYFGPIGVGAVYYATVVVRRIAETEGEADESAILIQRLLPVVVYFLVLTSVLTHGVTIAVAMLANYTRTITITNTFNQSGRSRRNSITKDGPDPRTALDSQATMTTISAPFDATRPRSLHDEEAEAGTSASADVQPEATGSDTKKEHVHSQDASNDQSINTDHNGSRLMPPQVGTPFDEVTFWREGSHILREETGAHPSVTVIQ